MDQKLIIVGVLLILLIAVLVTKLTAATVEGFGRSCGRSKVFCFEGSTNDHHCGRITENCKKYNTMTSPRRLRKRPDLRKAIRKCVVKSRHRCDKAAATTAVATQAPTASPNETELSDSQLCPRFYSWKYRCPTTDDIANYGIGSSKGKIQVQTKKNRVDLACKFERRETPCELDNKWLGSSKFPGANQSYHSYRDSYIPVCVEYYNKMCGDTKPSAHYDRNREQYIKAAGLDTMPQSYYTSPPEQTPWSYAQNPKFE